MLVLHNISDDGRHCERGEAISILPSREIAAACEKDFAITTLQIVCYRALCLLPTAAIVEHWIFDAWFKDGAEDWR
ncbi:MAG: hypothetical protein PVJ86_10515 [Phycisphaerales bacterium]